MLNIFTMEKKIPVGNINELSNKYYFYKWPNLCFITVISYEK